MKEMTFDEMKELIGREVIVGDWYEVSQERINLFADATDDHQFIHVDPEKAREGPFGTTIAHGFLTLSLLSVLVSNKEPIVPKGTRAAINYGFNKVRFLNPVPSGSRIRDRASLQSVEDKGNGKILITMNHVVEIEGREKPAMSAEWMNMFFT